MTKSYKYLFPIPNDNGKNTYIRWNKTQLCLVKVWISRIPVLSLKEKKSSPYLFSSLKRSENHLISFQISSFIQKLAGGWCYLSLIIQHLQQFLTASILIFITLFKETAYFDTFSKSNILIIIQEWHKIMIINRTLFIYCKKLPILNRNKFILNFCLKLH